MRTYKALLAADIPDRVQDRFLSRMAEAVRTADGADTCWIWPLSVGGHGYGQVGWNDKDRGRSTMQVAHRVSYVLLVGPIPENMTVDHVCRTLRCFRPDHLRLLTPAENGRRNAMFLRTHCPAGHAYDEVNTYVEPRTGHRRCRECVRASSRARRAA